MLYPLFCWLGQKYRFLCIVGSGVVEKSEDSFVIRKLLHKLTCILNLCKTEDEVGHATTVCFLLMNDVPNILSLVR